MLLTDPGGAAQVGRNGVRKAKAQLELVRCEGQQ